MSIPDIIEVGHVISTLQKRPANSLALVITVDKKITSF